MTAGSGLRERKKDDTRRALVDTAYRLTLDRGYDGFTVADLAEAVGISRRTFSNYFSSRAECVLSWNLMQAEFAVGELLAAEPDEPIPALIRRLLQLVTADMDGRAADFAAVVGAHPELRAEAAVVDQKMATILAAGIAGRLGIDADDVVAESLSLFALTACRVVTDRWLADGRPGGTPGFTASLERVFLILDPVALDALRHRP
ncbi:TetR/AcrR family transcriptional regulator [Nakamurella deserti]|uniref:TetR/AcrR family transcriptional regulator n=1 Tax=Nakamurella deserti TaxID=2164074 RepID=UPI000DBE9A5A|nr:TetR/AcrR family transcriptional regulator [Nakamurella deserti]